ncbi:hypothetical protein NDU88_001663 [Pleurodeles waltl]|uniref:Uncharacterized protein n=1 Tax=Pleurodeles waltl TaxID=8319 RepID=A0AAV7M1T0_PLEWA|nr:hypothetical protein NDU88_001663 [Pleurodeles waltl]
MYTSSGAQQTGDKSGELTVSSLWHRSFRNGAGSAVQSQHMQRPRVRRYGADGRARLRGPVRHLSAQLFSGSSTGWSESGGGATAYMWRPYSDHETTRGNYR